MTAAKGVCKAVSEVVTKPNAYHDDLPNPDSNGISIHNLRSDPDNSNAFVNGANGLSEDPVANRDVVLTDPELVEVQGVEFDAQSGKLDTSGVEISELLGGGHYAVEGTNGIFAVENDIPHDQHNSLGAEGLGVANGANGNLPVEKCYPQDQQNSLGGEGHDVVNGANGILPVENCNSQDQQNSLGGEGHGIVNGANGNLPVKNGTPQDQQNSLGNGVGVQDSATDATEEQVGKTENEAAVEIQQVQDQTGNTEGNVEDEIEQVQEQSGKTEINAEDGTESNAEDEIEQRQDQFGKIGSSAEDEIEQVQVQDQTGKTESSAEDEIEQVQDQSGKTESNADDEIEQVQNQSGKTERNSEDESELVQDQSSKTESSTAEDEIEQVEEKNEETEIEKVDDWIKSESSPNAIENQKSQVGLGTQLGEGVELNNLLSDIIVSSDAIDKCQSYNLELDVVSDAVECESRKIEVGEVSSGEVPVTTSMHLDPKSWPLINEEKTKTKLETEKSRSLFSRRWVDMVRTPLRKTKIVHDHAFKENIPLPPRPEEPVEHPVCREESPIAVNSEIVMDVSRPTDSFPASIFEAHEPQFQNFDAKSTEEISSSSSDGLRLKVNVENDPVVDNISLGGTNNDANEREDNGNGISTASPKGFTDDILGRENLSVEAAARPFFLVRIPKFNDRKLREQIRHAQLEVDENTRLRNVIQLEIQKTRNEHFRKYMGDAAASRDCAFDKDREELHRLCSNQVENIMKLWNTNDEFRKEYVKQNERSTLKRFGSLDGRSLGPDEAPHNLPGYVDEIVGKLGSTPAKVGSIQSSPLELSEPKANNRTTTNKEPAKPVLMNALSTVSGEDVISEIKRKPMKSKKEVKLERKVEEESREEAKAKLKEQLRLEEIEKAKLALERKKRNAEKAQRRAEQQAQKVAEQKQKEREKRLKKKERKKASAAPSGVHENMNIGEAMQSQTEILKGTDGIKEKNSAAVAAATKRLPKQSKSKYNNPPAIVRKQNKKKWQPWILSIILACLIVAALLLLGNTGIFTNANHKWW